MLKTLFRKIALPLFAALLLFALFACQPSEDEEEGEGQFFLDSYFKMQFYGASLNQKKLCRQEIIGFLRDFEQKASAHIEDSEVSRFNRAKAGEWVQLSEHVYKLFELSMDYYQKSGGAFNFCLYDLSNLWGFMRDDGFFGVEELPSDEEIESLLAYADPSLIELSNGGAVKLCDGVKVDFGAVAKGYALDVCGEIARKHGIKSALFNLAGNVYAVGYKAVASGCSESMDTFSIGITDPRMGETGREIFGGVRLVDTSVSVSGDYERYFLKGGVRYCHVIDPFTGWPVNTGDFVSGIISVAVIGKNAAMSDAFSTAVMVSGFEEGRRLLESNGLSGIIITSDKKYYVVGEVDLFGVNSYERGQWQASTAR